MRLFLDTSYFLPMVGIAVRGIPKDFPVKLMNEGHEIFMGEVSVFELCAKGAKYVAAGELPAERVTRGIRAVTNDERVGLIATADTGVLLTAFKLREFMSDFVDCLIIASAVNRCDALITEDNLIHRLKKQRELSEFLASENPTFKIERAGDML